MDTMGVEIQAISPSPTQYHYDVEVELSREITRTMNEAIADACAVYPERLVGLGTVSLQSPRLAAEQARHAVRSLGLRGVEVSSLIDGAPIDDRRFDPFWAEMEALGAVVLLHPLGTTMGDRLDDFYLSNIVGQPVETTVALLRMIFGGLFDRHETLKLCAVHGGGYLTLNSSRADHAYRVRPECQGCRHPPSHYLRRLWFDTVVHEPSQLRGLIEAVGADRIVLGTDYPFDMGEADPIGLIEALDGISINDQDALIQDNARKLLGLPAAGPLEH